MTASPRAIPFLEPVTAEALTETRAFNTWLEALLASQPSMHTIPLPAVRRVRRAGGGIFPPAVVLPQARTLTISGRAGEISLRVLAPTKPPRGVYLHLHGGGWSLGGADMEDVAHFALAEATGLVVVSVEYRLAPEHPFPAGPDDCEDAARWLVAKGAEALEAPAWFAIGGESAGAHLSVVTLLRLRDRHGISGVFHAANLVYGAYDLSKTPSVRRWGDRNLVLSNPIIDCFAEAFLPARDLESRRDPEVSPLFADLRAMPPAIFTVGTLDPLVDDTLFMEALWRASGAATELRVWPESVHGFNAFPLAIGRAANAAQHRFLVDAIAKGS